jgi:hypothetical protein
MKPTANTTSTVSVAKHPATLRNLRNQARANIARNTARNAVLTAYGWGSLDPILADRAQGLL